MNEYKMAWLQQCNMMYDNTKVNQSSDDDGSSFYEHVKSNIITGVATGVMMSGLKHAAQSQLKGRLGIALRVGGRVGVRAVPVIGTAMTIYSIYKFLED